MAKTSGKPVPKRSRKNARQHSRDESNIFVVLWEIIRLLCKKCGRLLIRFFKKAFKNLDSLIKNADFSFLGDYKLIVPAVSAVAVVIVTFALIWGFTNKNAYEIFVGEKSVGIIKLNKNVTAESLTSAVTTIISNNLGMKIRLSESLTIQNVHASSKKMETEDALLSKLTASLEYQAEAVSVMLEGVEVALLKNDAEYEAVTDRLMAPYIKENMTIVDKGFVENLAPQKRFADVSEITTADKAYERLSAKYETEITYTVKSGDVMGSIATNNGSTVEDICALNSIAIEDAHKLKVGQQLKIAAEKPILSVRIVEEIKYTEVTEYETVTQLNPNAASGSKVVQQGKNGQSEVTAHVVKINGAEVSREIVERVPVVPPVNEIVEVGSN